MSKRIVVDPITRIEGHLRVEVVVDDNNKVTEAYSSATVWRGLENIVKGRDPRDAGFLHKEFVVFVHTHTIKQVL